MRQNSIRIFHGFIIASICCAILVGCGHKTHPVYVDKNGKQHKVNLDK